MPKFDNRITGSETVDSFLNEIVSIIINDYVTTWYEIITDDQEFTSHAIKKIVISAGANVSNRWDVFFCIHGVSSILKGRFRESRVKTLHSLPLCAELQRSMLQCSQ